MPHFGPTERAKIIGGIGWFKKMFGDEIKAGVKGLPYHVDFMTAIAIQETFEVWGQIYNDKNRTREEILMLCTGDPLDLVNGRDSKAWPHDRADMERVQNGNEMFRIARSSLEKLGPIAAGKSKWIKDPNKFCHAFGIFQYDIQVFITGDA
jgi:hypothetical protein